MKNIVLVIVIGVLLTACGGEEVTPVVNPVPDLQRFDIVDSYGVDTGNSSAPLAIDPYLYNGMFDVFWKVNSLEDYRVNIRINDRPSVDNSFLIYSEICGVGRACDQSGSVICEYTSDFTLSCNNSDHPKDIGELFTKVPQTQYLILEVCDLDSSYCAFDYYAVSMQ